jgi:hypothetical protein
LLGKLFIFAIASTRKQAVVLGGYSIYFSRHTDQADVGDGTLRAVVGAA